MRGSEATSVRNETRVLAVGATRGTGHLVARSLLREGYAVRILARNAARARKLFGAAVEIVEGDLTAPATLAAISVGVGHIVCTAGVTKRPARESLVRATEYDGVRNLLTAAKNSNFEGRFLYMTSIGASRLSLMALLLNWTKGKTLRWRKAAEDAIEASGLDYTIVRAGILTNNPGGRRAIEVTQIEHPLTFRYRISRADVAEVLIHALRDPRTRRTTFEVVGGRGRPAADWSDLFSRLGR